MNKVTILLTRVSILKTLYFNFKFLPFKQAIKFPILIGKCVKFRSLKGKIELHGDIKTAMITIGIMFIFRDDPNKHTIIELNGKMIFNGRAIFRSGTIIGVGKNGTATFGDGFQLGADSVIYVKKCIVFGDCVKISWNNQILDTDFHYIRNTLSGEVFHNTKQIIIGNNVWIGNHVSINKGAVIPDNTIVSSFSLVNKKFEKEYCVIGGMPAKILKEDCERIFDVDEETELNRKFEINV